MRTVALLLAALAFTAAPSLAGDDKPTQPAAATAAKKLVAGMPAPSLTVDQWVKGSPVTSFEAGKVYVVEFWATWCGPCVASMPHLTELQKEFKDKGVTIIGVSSVDKRNSLEKVKEMVASKGDALMGYTVAWDKDRATSTAFMKAAEQNGIPCSFVVDKTGTIAYIGHPMYLDLVLDKVVAGSWSPEAGMKEVAAVEEELDGVFQNSDPKAALKAFNGLEAKHPRLMATFEDQKYSLQLASGDTAGAQALGMKLLDKAVASKDSMKLNGMAWNIVDPESKVQAKDLDFAYKAANEAVKLTEGKDGAILDTLARVYWLKGDKAKAVETQTKALAATPDGKMKDEMAKTLEEYKK